MGKKRIITKTGANPDGLDSKSGEEKSTAAKSKKKQVLKGQASIFSSYNNTIVTVADDQGNTLSWASSGSSGFKGARKSTPYAATIVAKEAVEKAKRFGLIEVSIAVRGIGPGREAAIRSIASSGLNISAIVDNTPMAHNGVRPPKPRRV